MVKEDWLGQLHQARIERDSAIIRVNDLVRWAREDGASWEEIAKALGVTRQAAWERYGPKVEEPHRPTS
jgi:hypothetical protein